MVRLLICTALLLTPPLVWAQDEDPPPGVKSDPGEQSSPESKPAQVLLDASGPRGQDGVDGVSYEGQQASGYSATGRSGGDASEPTAGGDAGSLKLMIGRTQDGQRVRIHGHRIAKPGAPAVGVDRNFLIHPRSEAAAIVRGGDGGMGAVGGTPEKGGRGRPGPDAVENRRGGDGERGGRTGNRGKGTSGAAGGLGGLIEGALREADIDLLMFFRFDARGGKGGAAGANGKHVEAPRGGAGGDDLHWTSTRWVPTWTTDAKGNSRMSMRMVTDHHYEYPGNEGPAGWPSPPLDNPLTDGDDAADGRTEITVQREDGTSTTHKSRGDLRIKRITYEGDGNGVHEPEETMRVLEILFVNVGDMETPAGIAVRIQDTDQLEFERQDQLVIEEKIPAGGEYLLKGPLEFKIKDVEMTAPGPAYHSSDGVIPTATVMSVGRPYPELSGLAPIDIAFPLEISYFGAYPSLKPGQVTAVVLKVTNTTDKPIRVDRILQSRMRLVAGSANDVIYMDADGRKVSIDDGGFLKAIEGLPGHQSAYIDAFVGVSPDAEPYTSFTLQATSEIGRIDNGRIARATQHQTLTVRVSEAYRTNRKAEVLLITNNRTTSEEIQGWRNWADSLGSQMSVWDLSLNGFLAMGEQFRHKGDDLMRDFEGKLIVFLLDEIDLPDQTTAHTLEFLAKVEFLRAVMEKGIGVHFPLLSGASAEEILEYLMRPEGQSLARDYPSLAAYLAGDRSAPIRARFMDDERPDGWQPGRSGESHTITQPAEEFQSIHVEQGRWRPPTEETLVGFARRLDVLLNARYPERRYEYEVLYSGDVIPQHWLTTIRRFGRKTYTLGRIHVRRGIGGGMPGSATVRDLRASDPHSPVHIGARGTYEAAFLAMSIDELIERLERVGNRKALSEMKHGDFVDVDQARQALVDAITVKVAEMQFYARGLQFEWFLGKELSRVLGSVQRLASRDFGGEAVDSVAELAARLRFLARTQKRWYHHIPVLGWFGVGARVSRRLNRIAQKMMENLARRGNEYDRLKLEVDERVQLWEDNLPQKDRRQEALRSSILPKTAGIVTEESVLLTTDSRIHTTAQMAALQTRTRQAEQRRVEVEAIQKKAQAGMVLGPRRCENIFSGQPPRSWKAPRPG